MAGNASRLRRRASLRRKIRNESACENLDNRARRAYTGGVMSGTGLHWDASYEIVLALMETYPDADLDQLGINELNERILQLPDFDDDPALVNDAILRQILRDWYEESGG